MDAYAAFFIGSAAIAIPSVLLLVVVARRHRGQADPSVNPA
jgi:hypothetical protein